MRGDTEIKSDWCAASLICPGFFSGNAPEDCRFLHAKTWFCRGDFGVTSMTDGVLKQNYQEFQKQLVFFGLRLNLP